MAISAAADSEDNILELDCTDLISRIHDGSLRAERVCAAFLCQYERFRSLNAMTWIEPSQVLSSARDVDRARANAVRLPALAGLPIVVKDNINAVGWPTSAGTPSLGHCFPRRNAPVVERLVSQGAIVMGKANMHELAMGATSSNPTFGFVRNPYRPNLIPGGSSGGSAAAIAARIAPVALGTDTGGSVRIPAAFCGVVGFRPSTYPRRRYSQEGVVPVVLDLDTIGPMGRSVADVALLHAVIIGERPVQSRSLNNVRIGVPRHAYWEDLDSEVERVAEGALARLRVHGAVLVEIDLREVKVAAERIAGVLASAAVEDLGDYLCRQVPPVPLQDLIEQIASLDVRTVIKKLCANAEKLAATGVSPELLSARGYGRDAIVAAYRTVFRQHDIQAVVFPTEVLAPPPIDPTGDDPDRMIEFKGRTVPLEILFRNTVPAVALGAPALSVPAGLTHQGMPVALEFDGLPGDDSALLAIGMAAESAIGRVPAATPVEPSTENF